MPELAAGDSEADAWRAVEAPPLPREDGPETPRIIGFGFAVVLLLMAVLTVLGLTRLDAMKARMVALVAESGVKIESVYQMRSLARERFASLAQIVLIEDAFDQDDEVTRFREQARAFIRTRDRLLALGMQPQENALWQRARRLIQIDERLHDRVLDLALSDRRGEAAALLVREVRPVEMALIEAFDALVAQYHVANQASLREAEADFRRAELIMLGLLGLALALSLTIAWRVMVRAHHTELALEQQHESAVAAAQQLSWAAGHDALTGLANRHAMQRRLAELVRGAHLEGESHVLLYIDLDHFKSINDACGHHAGDQALRQVAACFLRHVRSGDLVARVGGDEFCIGLANCGPESAGEIAEAIRNDIAHHRFAWEGASFDLGASIGLVPLGGVDHVDAALKAADAACYRAKAAGRNQVHGAAAA